MTPDISSGQYEQDDSASSESPIPGVECPECNQMFDNERAFVTHRCTHAELANNARLSDEHKEQPEEEENQEDSESDSPNEFQEECSRWNDEFSKFVNEPQSFNLENFNATFNRFTTFLFEANQRLPGPLHPAVKMYRLRKEGKVRVDDAQYSRSTNPQRVDARRRQRCRDRYQYERAQYEYFNQRRKVVRRVLNSGSDKAETCRIQMEQLEVHYRSVFGTVNSRTLEHYVSHQAQSNIELSVKDIELATKTMKLDTSPGYDRVLARTIRHLPVNDVIKKITDIMLANGCVPSGMCLGRTALIHKGGEQDDVSNWRPVTIYSILRRIIERALDKKLRDQIELNPNQRGFVNVPGCHVNATLVQACLQKAKSTKTNCTVVFLDMSKAYDNIGHDHIERCLLSQGVSSNLKNLIMGLLKNNSIRVDVGTKKSNPIEIKRSVPQGGPLSPILFNMAIDHIFKEICDPVFANRHGYKLYDDLDALSLIGFADDLAVISSTPEGALRIVELVQAMLDQIGLKINPKKSMAINIQDGRMVSGQLRIRDGAIACIDPETRIKYLGSSFTDELVFDSTVVGKITDKLNTLIKSPLLKRDQKLNIVNQYILPMLTFPLQAAPIRMIPARDLEVMDLNIRNSIKAIIGLPTRTSTEMFYAPRKYRGLGLVRCQWEVFLQHFAIAQKLSNVPDVMFRRSYDCASEMRICREALGVEADTTRKLRAALRNDAYERWSAQPYQGIGVMHFKTYPKANKFMMARSSLSTSEWVAALKLNTNYANLAGVPGVSGECSSASSIRCRRCGSENETIPHVLGACDFSHERRTERHHVVKRRLQVMLQEQGLVCIDEATCVDKDGSSRRVDILAFDPKSDRAYIIDPTIRFETNEDLDDVVKQEKERIYRGCIRDLSKRYQQYGKRDFEVIGLWWGARGAISKGVDAFFGRFNLDKKALPDIAESVLVASLRMLHHHIYGA